MNTNHNHTTTKIITLNGVQTIYTICTDGTITNTKKGNVLKHSLCGNYYKVSICHNKQTHSVYVHRLLALHFLEVPEGENIVVDHINNNKLDNSLSNLNWITQSENILKTTRATEYNRVPESVRTEIISKYYDENRTAKSLANEYDIPLSTIYTIARKNK